MQVYKSELIVSSVRDIKKNTLNVSLFPNPVMEKLTISLNLDKAKVIKVKVTDLTGREIDISKTKNYYPAGNHIITLPVTGYFDPGIYILSIKSGESNVSRKFIVN